MARVIRQTYHIARCFEEIGGKRDSGRGFRGEEFKQLRDFDDGGGGDDEEAEGFGEAEGEAGGVGEEGVQERFVAVGAEEGEGEVVEGGGEVGGDRLEVGAEGVEEGVHCAEWDVQSRGRWVRCAFAWRRTLM